MLRTRAQYNTVGLVVDDNGLPQPTREKRHREPAAGEPATPSPANASSPLVATIPSCELSSQDGDAYLTPEIGEKGAQPSSLAGHYNSNTGVFCKQLTTQFNNPVDFF